MEERRLGSAGPQPMKDFVLKGHWYNYIDFISLIKVEKYIFTIAQSLWQERREIMY